MIKTLNRLNNAHYPQNGRTYSVCFGSDVNKEHVYRFLTCSQLIYSAL